MNLKHGQTTGGKPSPEYKVWISMIRRCEDPHRDSFRHYGGKGIKVCKQWRRSFTSFLADMGQRPSLSHSIDRFPDRDGNYEPGNCRWATPSEQVNNMSRTRRFTVNGETLSLKEWSDRSGLPYKTLRARVYRGVNFEIAIVTPFGKRCCGVPAEVKLK